MEQKQTNRFGTTCSKCNENFEDKLTECPNCGNKAYLQVFSLTVNEAVVTEHLKERLNELCKTDIPDDVVAVAPSILLVQRDVKEVEDEQREQAKVYKAARDAKDRKAKEKLKKAN